MKHETKLIARYAETDMMGIIHHSVYPVWFEAARTEFIKKAGISYSECEKRGLMLPLIGLECKYIKPAHYEDGIIVETTIAKMSPVRLVMEYKVMKEADGIVLAEGTTTHVWTDTGMKPVNIKKHNPEIYSIIEKASG
jgi:acyl-CoA thioester hydrolase